MPRDYDDELKREIQTHLELEAEERVADGMSEADAKYAARRAFGNVTRTQEDVRALWTRRWIDEIVQDVRYALRTLRKAPGFTTVAVLTLALGIGANTAMFSVVNAVILQPLGYPQPEQLRFLTTRFERQGVEQSSVSAPEYFELTEINQSFYVVGAFTIGEVNLAALDRPRRVTRATVNAELLEALAVQPERGRWFRRDETRANGPALVILSQELWLSAFGAREDIVGRTIEIDGLRREVIGIMPASFDLMDNRVEVWLPLQLAPAFRQFREIHFLNVLGRLKDEVTAEQAEAELASLVATWGERAGVSGHVFTPGDHVMQMEPVQNEIVGSARRALWMLQAAVAFVLLIACANLANLLLARAETRRRELAVRAALGAGQRRLLAQFTAEGVVLSLVGGAIGLALAWAGVRALIVAYPNSLPRVADIAIDPAVLGFTLLVSVVTGVAFGLAPLLHSLNEAPSRLLSERATRGATSARHAVRRALVAAEVALAVVLVVGAGLMFRTVVNLMNVDAGFNRSRLVTFGVALPASTYPNFDQRLRLYQRLIDRFTAMPGIERVSAVAGLPPQREVNGLGTDIEGYAPPPGTPRNWVDYYQTVTTGYFEAMGIPIVAGRPFDEADRIGAPMAIVNEAFARRFWKDLDPIGRRVRPRFGEQTPWVTVIGVAKDVKQRGVDQPTGAELYFLLEQLPQIFPTISGPRLGHWGNDGSMNIVLRSALPMATLQPPIAAAVREADPSLPIIRLRPMDEVVTGSLRRPRMLMHLFGGFAALALLLAAIGTYGVLSYLVTERRREIGIRMALGAKREAVLRSVMAYGLKLTGIGLAAGLAGALALTRLMETLLFEVRPTDPATLVSVAAVITFVAIIACLVPAHRATRVDPIAALREE
ncbi:MAG: ABC transporter permease [Acidobacteria bacterium]|nr:MAG: ABC transporter permease [Acidobacteriota bacterium]